MSAIREEKNKKPGKIIDIRNGWNRNELEFLPAALEIVETPPSPIGRALLWIIVSFFVIAITWSVIGRVDEVAVAPGKVIPSGYTKVVQAEDKGIVRKLNVTNGTRVKAGDVLIELDATVQWVDIVKPKDKVAIIRYYKV
jgi:hemolysin D